MAGSASVLAFKTRLSILPPHGIRTLRIPMARRYPRFASRLPGYCTLAAEASHNGRECCTEHSHPVPRTGGGVTGDTTTSGHQEALEHSGTVQTL